MYRYTSSQYHLAMERGLQSVEKPHLVNKKKEAFGAQSSHVAHQDNLEKAKALKSADAELKKFETMLERRVQLLNTWQTAADGDKELKTLESQSGVAGVGGLRSRTSLEAFVDTLVGSSEEEMQELSNAWGTSVCPGAIDPARNLVAAVKTAVVPAEASNSACGSQCKAGEEQGGGQEAQSGGYHVRLLSGNLTATCSQSHPTCTQSQLV